MTAKKTTKKVTKKVTVADVQKNLENVTDYFNKKLAKEEKRSKKLTLNNDGAVVGGAIFENNSVITPKKPSVKISKKTDPGYCIVMTSPNKPRKFVVVGTFEEAKLIMANAREKDPFVDFMVFEKISLLDNGNGNILKGMAKAA